MINFIKSIFKRKPEWEYGVCNNTTARRHRKKGNVQMILHEKGKYGRKEDYWHNFDSSWWPQFKPLPGYPIEFIGGTHSAKMIKYNHDTKQWETTKL